MRTFLLVMVMGFSFPFYVGAQSKKEPSPHKEESHEADAHSHEEEDEGGANVGPDKGILEASDEKGIKLSPEALRNFEIKTTKLTGKGPWSVPASARLQSAEETNLYRVRNGFFKRVDFSVGKRTAGLLTVESQDLADGDEIVTEGMGYLRISEIAAFGGAPEGHSH